MDPDQLDDSFDDAAVAQPETIHERIDRAVSSYLGSLTTQDIGQITVEAVAQLAGVSRATAYRYLGSRDNLVYLAALSLTRDHVARVHAILERLPTFSERLQEG